MKKVAVLSLVALVGSSLLASAQTAQDLKIKERSSFNAPPSARNPFWPIGWQKEAAPSVQNSVDATVPLPPPELLLKPENFIVSSISTGRTSLALINGKAYGEGDLIPYDVGGQKIAIQVYSIRDGMVTLRYKDKTIVSAIKGTLPPRSIPR